ncbi:MAG: hypothetical protein K9M56_03205 [Victivallales bacterium]|nr:hypothetical protein [Victivallales bacterium]
MKNNKEIRNSLLTVIIVAAVICVVYSCLFRIVWFDEALTILDFVSLKGNFLNIYYNYVIPNNHIVFTVLLKLWLKLQLLFFPLYDFSFRLFPAFTSVVSILFLFGFYRKKYMILSAFAVLLAFVLSRPFEIYAVSIRGYSLSFLFIVILIEICRRWAIKKNIKNGVLFFIFSLLAVGSIPVNIIFVYSVIIFFLPDIVGRNKPLTYRIVIFILLPLAAFLLFYLPIFQGLYSSYLLKEGWKSSIGALVNIYLPFLTAFLPVIPFSIIGNYYYNRKKPAASSIKFITLLIPLFCCSFFYPAPFPRVFFPLWPVWILITAGGVNHFFSFFSKQKRYKIFCVMILAILVWGYFKAPVNKFLSSTFTVSKSSDDYFEPDYLNINSDRIVDYFLKKAHLLPDNSVFVSFKADKYSILFYGKMFKIGNIFVVDGANEQLQNLPNLKYLVVRNDSDLRNVMRRFKIDRVWKVKSFGSQKVFKIIQPNL